MDCNGLYDYAHYFSTDIFSSLGQAEPVKIKNDEISEQTNYQEADLALLKPRKRPYGKRICMKSKIENVISLENECPVLVYGGEIVLRSHKTSIKFGLDIHNNYEFTIAFRKLGKIARCVCLSEKNFDLMFEKMSCIIEQLSKFVNRQLSPSDSRFLFLSATFECSAKLYKDILHVSLKERQSCETGFVFGGINAEMTILREDFQHFLDLMNLIQHEKSVALNAKQQIINYVDLYKIICLNQNVDMLEVENTFEPLEKDKNIIFDHNKLFLQLSLHKNVIKV